MLVVSAVLKVAQATSRTRDLTAPSSSNPHGGPKGPKKVALSAFNLVEKDCTNLRRNEVF